MSRNITYSALALRVRPMGESNREAFFLTSEEGIIRAAVFGGAKSKLRSFVSPFHQGTLWIYYDPVKDFKKVTDFDVQKWRPGLREKYERAMAGAALSDTVLASHGGGGNWQTALDLAGNTLDALDNADENMAIRVFSHFLWNWADLIGEKPSLHQCAVCGVPFEDAASVLYAPAENGLLCRSCVDGRKGITLGAGARKWLLTVENLPPSSLSRYTLDAASLVQARRASSAFMADILGKRLESWDW